MLYVDENLCSGCGACVDVCRHAAITLQAAVAAIDEAECTLCGLCVDACPVEAIIEAEVVSESSLSPSASPVPAFTSAVSRETARPEASAVGPAWITAQPEGTSKLEVAQKVLSGLLAALDFALDRRARRPSGSRLLRVLTGGNLATRGAGAVGSRNEVSAPGMRKRLREGGPGSGKGIGDGRGRGRGLGPAAGRGRAAGPGEGRGRGGGRCNKR